MAKGKTGRQIRHHIKKQLDRNYRKKLKGYETQRYDKPQSPAGDTIE
jgi:hypothetical protein